MTPPLVLVTGKGGTGKTTVAAALVSLLAARGRRVLFARLGSHPGPPPPGAPAQAIDGDDALREYLAIVLGARLAGRICRSRLFRRFVAAAPGLRELMAVGKVADEARGGLWDTVVVDTPATGHLLQGMRMPAAAGAVFGGLVLREVERLQRELGDPAHTRVVPVALAEEMAVHETLDLLAGLSRLGLRSEAVVVNKVHRPLLGPVPTTPAGASPLLASVLACAREEEGWAALNARQVAHLRAGVAVRVAELPFLACEELGAGELALLAAELDRQGVL